MIDWMNWLKDDIGFEGWRFDFVKGYAPEFMQDYCGKTVGNDAWNVGEYWADLRLVTANNANDQCLITACAWNWFGLAELVTPLCYK